MRRYALGPEQDGPALYQDRVLLAARWDLLFRFLRMLKVWSCYCLSSEFQLLRRGFHVQWVRMGPTRDTGRKSADSTFA